MGIKALYTAVGMLFVSAKSERCREYHITYYYYKVTPTSHCLDITCPKIVFGVFQWNLTHINV